MKNFKWVPLLLVIPFVIILGALCLIDHPNPPEKSSDTVVKVVTEEGKDQTEGEQNNNNSNQAPADGSVKYQELKLVIGNVGSVEAGGSTPIYFDPDEESEKLATLQYNCAVLACDEQIEDGWVYVELPGKVSNGYVKEEDVIKKQLLVGSADPVRDSIVKDALSYMGLKFIRYGTSLEKGVDCSNFIQKMYEHNGLMIPTDPIGQHEAGVDISLEEAQPGDIIFYDRANNGTGHVGLYLGDGFIIHSSGHEGRNYPEGGVHISAVLYHDRDHYLVTDVYDTIRTQSTQDGGNNE